MALEGYSLHLEGQTELVLHNNLTVDQLHPLKKKIASITSKKKKTDADCMELRRLEFQAGLYWSKELGPYVPNANLRKMLIEGAKKDKRGKDFESGLFVIGHAPIQYEGPRDLKSLIDDESFSWRTVVGNQRNSVMRTRPRFNPWSLEFEVKCDEQLISRDMLENAIEHASVEVGLCDGRSIGCGRFRWKLTDGVNGNGRG